LKKPVTVIERDGEPYLVVPANSGPLPADFTLVRTKVSIEPLNETFILDFTKRSPETDEICLRFLRFEIQKPLRNNFRLWQPKSGYPFYERNPKETFRSIQLFSGFQIRPVITNDGNIGLCLDVTSCFVSATPLPTVLDYDTFSREWKGKHCIYHFGDQWYEIKLHALDNRNVSEYPLCLESGQSVKLLNYIHDQASKPISSELANLAENAAVVFYLNPRNEERAAAAPLCYPLVDLSEVQRQHRLAIFPPSQRYRSTLHFADQYLQNLRFGNIPIKVASKPLEVTTRYFCIPDLEFGNRQKLSVRGSPNVCHVKLVDAGKMRLKLLHDPNTGFFIKTPLDRQYLILPRSIHDSMGVQFLKDLKSTLQDLFPQPSSYSPKVVNYNDYGAKSFVRQTHAIIEAVKAAGTQPGYGIVMLHHVSDRASRQEDQLEAAVVRKLYDEFDLRVGIIHCDMIKGCYREVIEDDGRRRYRSDPTRMKSLRGYLRNVAINKVLLINRKWPYVLAERLHADITIGIDVKNNTCGLLAVGQYGADIRPELKESRQKEQLKSEQIKKYIYDLLYEEAQGSPEPLKTIVIHRDGICWPSELQGAQQAILALRKKGILPPDATLTVLQIAKSSPAPLRLYHIDKKNGQSRIENAQVGNAYFISDTEAYLCSTGQPFLRQGTARPLHIKKVSGPLPLADCIEDLYALTVLATWSQPEGCARYPITQKLNDRYLRDAATNYDNDALDFTDYTDDEEEAA